MVPATPHKGGLGGSIPPSATFSRRMAVAFPIRELLDHPVQPPAALGTRTNGFRSVGFGCCTQLVPNLLTIS